MQAIETEYAGWYFRSRLEARWAVFFDVLGLEYVYEAEGFELSNGMKYLPDFWFPHQDLYFEIKPNQEALAQDGRKLLNFVWEFGCHTICVGVPGDATTRTFAVLDKDDPRLRFDTPLGKRWEIRYRHSDGQRVIAYHKKQKQLWYILKILAADGRITHKKIMSDIDKATNAARSARFGRTA